MQIKNVWCFLCPSFFFVICVCRLVFSYAWAMPVFIRDCFFDAIMQMTIYGKIFSQSSFSHSSARFSLKNVTEEKKLSPSGKWPSCQYICFFYLIFLFLATSIHHMRTQFLSILDCFFFSDLFFFIVRLC